MVLYFLIGILFFISAFFVGSFLISFTNVTESNAEESDLVIRVLLGVFAITGIYASVKSGFSTIFILFFASLFLIIKRKKANISFQGKNQEEVHLFGGYLILCTLWHFIYQWDNNFVFHGDQIFYSIISNTFIKTGKETVYAHSILNIGSNGNTPYHYLEIWITTLLKEVFNTPADYTHVFTVIPFFAALSCYAFHEYLGKGFKMPVMLKMLFFFTILHTASFLPQLFFWVPKILPHIESYTRNPFVYPNGFKLLVPLSMVVYLVTHITTKDHKWLVMITFMLLLTTLTVGLCFWAALGLFLFFEIITGKSEVWKMVWAYSILSLLYGLFYYLTGSTLINNNNFWQNMLGSFSDLKTRINIFAGVSIACGVILAVYLLVYILIIRESKAPLFHKQRNLFVLAVMFMGTLSWSIFFKSIDSAQLCSNAISVLNILIWFMLICSIIKLTRFFPYVFIVFWICILIIRIAGNPHFSQFERSAEQKGISGKLSMIGFANLDSNSIKADPFVNNTTLNTGLHFVYSRPEPYFSCSPSILYQDYSPNNLDSTHQRQRQLQDLLYYYKLQSGLTASNDDLILSFARKYGVNHVFVRPGEVIPNVLDPYISSKMSIDSGDSLFFLNVR